MIQVFIVFSLVTLALSIIDSAYINNSSDLHTLSLRQRKLSSSVIGCDSSKTNHKGYEKYMKGMRNIYKNNADVGTCLPVHYECGWQISANERQPKPELPTFVLSVGLEGAGHHLWTEILEQPVHDCVWTNARHYERDLGDGVAKSSVSKLHDAITEQFKLRIQTGKPSCRMIYDSEDSFPTGAIRKKGRVFMRPDIVNLQLLDGVLFNTKYIVILRNVTDATVSALRRNFFTDVDLAMRTVESTLVYMEGVLRGYYFLTYDT